MEKAFNKFAWKNISEDFGYVVEQDFNPDFVQLFGLDAFERGLKLGVIFSALAFGTFTLCAFIKRKRRRVHVRK